MNVRPRNLLLIICDDLNTSLDRYGPRPAYTPNLDRFAARAVRFTRAYCQSPLCTPSRASLLSGLRPDRTGVHTLKENQFTINPDTVTLPRLLRERGFFTARSGKVFHKGVPDGVCTRRPGMDDPHAWCERREPIGYELNTNGQFVSPVPYDAYLAGAGGALAWLIADDRKDEQQHDVNVAAEVSDWIRTPREQPWMLAAGFARPHVPLVAPRRCFELYDDWDFTVPPRDETAKRDRPPHYASWFGADIPIADADLAGFIRAYYASVSFIDEQVGRLLDALDQSGQRDQTLIVFTADHGYQLGEHGLFFKRFLYEESVRVPLIIADPSRPHGHGQTHNEPVELLDVFPTVASALEVEHDLPLEGQSLLGLLDTPATETGRYAYVQTGAVPNTGGVEGRSVRNQRWAYHAWRNAETAEELYDLENDPGQFANLAGDAAYTQVCRELAERLAAHVPWP